MVLYNPDYSLKGAAADLHKRQFMDNHWRDQLAATGRQTLERRRGENAQLPDQYVQAGQAASAFQRDDDLRQQAFRAARMGTRGGSADIDRQTQARGAHGGRLAQLHSAGMDQQRQLDLADEQEFMRWLTQAYAPGAGDNLMLQAMLDASGARAGEINRMGDVALREDEQQVAHQGLRSQILGSQLTNAARAFQTAGRTGTGPAWAQQWGNSLTAGGGYG